MAEWPSVTCPRCGMTSRHPQDVADRYCGHCRLRHPGLEPLDELAVPEPDLEAIRRRAEAHLAEHQRRVEAGDPLAAECDHWGDTMALASGPHEFIGAQGDTCPLCDQPREHGLHQGMARCDFCNNPAIAWRYPTRRVTTAPARPGQLPNPAAAVHFGEAWLACAACHELIEAGLAWQLARRGADSTVANRRLELAPDEFYALTIQIRSLHAVFFTSRVGPAVGI